MNRRFTSEDILRYLYGEMEPSESERFLETLLADESLLAEFEALQEVQSELVGLNLNPSKSATDRVMRAAKRAAHRGRTGKNETRRTNLRKTWKSLGTSTILMLLVTSIAASGAIFAFLGMNESANSWDMTGTKASFVDTRLDERLQGARNRLEGILEDKHEFIAPVHHDTYRKIEADWNDASSPEITFLHLK